MFFFFFNETATTEIYTLSLHDALPIYSAEPGRTGQLAPDLATDLGTTPDGGLTWTFTLREGVRFETGAPITSRDVKYGIERSFASDVVVGGPTRVVELLDDPANP